MQTPEEPRPFTSRQVLRNATVQVTAKAVLTIMSLASGILITRYLGPTQYGAYTFAFSYLMLFNTLSDPGLSAIVVREIAASGAAVGERITGETASLRILASCFASLVICVSAYIIGYPTNLLLPICLASLSYVTLSLGQGAVGPFLQARLRMELQSAADVISNFAWLVGAILLVVSHRGAVTIFVGLYILSTVVNTLVILTLTRRLLRLRVRINLAYWKQILLEAWPVAVSMLLTSLYFRIDTMLLLRLKGQTAVGLYGAAHKFVDQAMPIGFFFATSLYPMLSNYHRTGDKQVNRVYQRSLDLMTMLGFTIATFGVIFAKPIISLLYGRAYVASADALRILSIAILFMCLNRIVGYNLYAMGRQRIYIVTGLAALALNLSINSLLIPRFSYVGCSIAKTVTEFCVWLMALAYTMHVMKFRPSVRMFVLCTVAAAATGGMVMILRSATLAVQLAAAVAVYASTLLATKAITIKELQALLKRGPEAEGVAQ